MQCRPLAFSLIALSLCFPAFAEDQGERIKAIEKRTEALEKEHKSLKKAERKESSRFKKYGKKLLGLLAKAGKIEDEYKRTEKRLADARSLPAGDADTRAQKQAAIRSHEHRKTKLAGDLNNYEKGGQQLVGAITKLQTSLSELVEKRQATLAELAGFEHELTSMGRDKPLFTLRDAMVERLDKGELGLLPDVFKDKGSRLSKKTRVIVVEAGQRWLVADDGKRTSYALTLADGKINVFGKVSGEERSKELKSEEKTVNGARKDVSEEWDRSSLVLKQMGVVLKQFDAFSERNKNRG